jgi:hypothetical protein
MALALMPFGDGSTRWFRSAVAQFSIANHINPATHSRLFVRMVLTINRRTTNLIVRADHHDADLKRASFRSRAATFTRIRQLRRRWTRGVYRRCHAATRE